MEPYEELYEKMTPEQQDKVRRCVDDMMARGDKMEKGRMFAVCTASVMREEIDDMEEKELTTSARKELSAGDFAVPGKRKLPIHDEAHVRNALARFNQTKDLTPEERKTALRKILAAARKFGIKVTAERFKKEAEEKEQEVNLLENQEVSFTEHFDLLEAAEPSDMRMINFVALQSGVSGNNRRYRKEEIEKQDLKGTKMFIDHVHEADNAVGIVKKSWMDGLKLKAEAEVFNTAKHPDLIQMIEKGLIDSVSIGGKGDVKRVKEGDAYIDEVHNLSIKEISFVGLGGVAGAKVTEIAKGG